MSSPSKPGPPPILHFDDGSRVMQESVSGSTNDSSNQISFSSSIKSERGKVPFQEYYEIERICDEIVTRLDLISIHNSHLDDPQEENNNVHQNTNNLPFLCKIALQFPDELLPDADDVCWAMEEGIQKSYIEQLEQSNKGRRRTDETPFLSPLVFVLGDTTYGSCCIDEIAALHLNADLIVHYGDACLSPTSNLPVIYSFGSSPMSQVEEDNCVDLVSREMLNQLEKEQMNSQNRDANADLPTKKGLLVLYNVRYHKSVPRIIDKLQKKGIEDVVMGQIPKQQLRFKNGRRVMNGDDNSNCCENGPNFQCCNTSENSCQEVTSNVHSETNDQTLLGNDEEINKQKSYYIGGLQVMLPTKEPSNNLSNYILLYIGRKCRQMVNIMLRCSGKDGTAACWSYTYESTDTIQEKESKTIFSIDASTICKRELNRRFYLTQKARMASIIGIVVGTLGVSRFQMVVNNLREKIEASGRGCYILVVGKVNVAKLANFGEVDTFVLVACPENSMLESRDFHVPVITPMEMEIALGEREWDGFYSNDFSDFLETDADPDADADADADTEDTIKEKNGNELEDKEEEDDDDDRPYFSLISGNYESNKKPTKQVNDLDLKNLPGKGQMTAYTSEAATYLQKREYQGLLSNIGQTKVAPASQGQVGIASDYGNR